MWGYLLGGAVLEFAGFTEHYVLRSAVFAHPMGSFAWLTIAFTPRATSINDRKVSSMFCV